MIQLFWWPKYLPWLLVIGATNLVLMAWLTTSSNQTIVTTIIIPSCREMSLSQQVAAADVIMTGKVFLVLPRGAMADVVVTPDIVYKGKVTEPSITIAALPLSEISGSSQLDLGQFKLHFASDQPPYLFYLRRRPDGIFATDECSGTRLLGLGLTSTEATALGDGQPVLVDPAPLLR